MKRKIQTSKSAAPILLLGNGVNRLQNGASWEAALEKLAVDLGCNKNIVAPCVPPTLTFERIVAESKKSELEVKRKLSGLLDGWSFSETHARLSHLFEEIITTNYDQGLELSLDGADRCADTIRETRYCLFRAYEASGKRVWHIHGDILRPNTIVIGHDHYAGQLQKIRNYMGAGVTTTEGLLSFKTFRENGLRDPKSWLDLFFTRDVHIVGLGLDYSEIDIWWLIVHKNSMLRKSENNSVSGTVTYWILKDERRLDKDTERKLELLASLGVCVKTISARTHLAAYKTFIRRFSK